MVAVIPAPLGHPTRGHNARRQQARPVAVPHESKIIRIAEAKAAVPSASRRREKAIQDAAYFRWAYRGCRPGEEVADWLAAEREVDEQLTLRDELIRDAAYSRWLDRGRVHGDDVQDWLAAEREVDEILKRDGILCGLGA